MDSQSIQMNKSLIIICSLFFSLIFGINALLAQTIDFKDDFATDPNTNGKWQIFRYANDSFYEAYWSSVLGSFYLTRNSGSKAVAVFANYDLKATHWQAKFDLKIGGGDGGDGLVFMFYKNKSSYGKPRSGGGLGFVLDNNEAAIAGYGLEFDTHGDYGIDSPHIAIIKDSQQNHLTYQINSNLRTNTNHHVEVNFQNGNIKVLYDGTQVISYAIPSMSYAYSGIGFCAATGGSNDNHVIDNFELWASDIKLISPDGGEYWAGGSNQNIQWLLSGSSAPLTNKFALYYSTDGGSTYPNLIADNIPSSSTSYSWIIPSVNTLTAKVKVQAKNTSSAVIAEDYSNLNFAIDSAQPSPFSLTSPANGEWTMGTPVFQWNTTIDNFSLSHYQLWIDGIIIKDSLFSNYYTIPDSKPQSPGVHTWKVDAIDKAGNIRTSTETRSIRIDNTGPAAFSLKAPADTTWTNNTLPTFEWQASSDLNSGLAKYQLYIDGYLWQDNINPTLTSVTLTSPLGNGSHVWNVQAVDKVSNVKKSNQTWTLKIDNAPPGGIRGIEGKYYSNPYAAQSPYFGSLILTRIDNTINFNWGSSSPASGIPVNDFQVRWSGYVETAQSGNYTFKTITDDGLRLWVNSQNLIDRWFDMKSEASTSSTIYLEANKLYPLIMEYYENEPPSNAQLFWTPPGRSEEIIPTSQLNVYPVPFFQALSPLNNSWTNTATLTFSWKEAVDPGIGLSRYQLWIDNSVKYASIPSGTTSITLQPSETLTHGNHSWYVKAIDKLGNSSQTATFTVRVDTQPPNVFSLVSPKDSAYVNFPTPNFSWNAANDVSSGLAKYQLWIDNSLSADDITATTSAPGNPLTEGYHTWFIKAIDKVGNEIKSNETRTVIGEWNPPETFELALPRNGDTLSTGKPVFSWHPSKDIGAGLKSYELWIQDRKNKGAIVPTDTTTTPLVNLSNGTYNWFVKAIDKLGNETPSNSIYQLTINRDITPPISTVIRPIDAETIGGTHYTINGNANDGIGSGVSKVEISFDNGASWKLVADTGTNFSSWEFVWSGYTSGTHTIISRAIDFEGNIEANKAGIMVNVNLSAPTISEVIVVPNPAKAGIVTFKVIFMANQSEMNNSVNPLVTFSPANDTTRYPIVQGDYVGFDWIGTSHITEFMNNGIATIHISGANDRYGNVMTPNNNAGSFRIDTKAPVVQSAKVLPGLAKAGNIDVTVQFIEAGTNLNALVSPFVTFTPADGTEVPFTQTSYDANEKIWSGTAVVTKAMKDGLATIEVRGAEDLAGNVMADDNHAGSFLIDATSPTAFELLAPPDSEWIANSRPTFIWNRSNDATTGLLKYQLFINDTLNIENISPTTTQILPVSPLGDGAYGWYVMAYDSALNNIQSTSKWVLLIDTTPPISKITNMASGMFVSADTVVIEGIANDGIGASVGCGVDSVFISFDGGKLWRPTISTGTNYDTWKYNWTGYINQNYTIKCKAIDRLGNREISGDGIAITEVALLEENALPSEFTISQNYPNPFNPTTEVKFTLPKSEQVRLIIYNVRGERVRTLLDESVERGAHSMVWNGTDDFGRMVPGGIYFLKMSCNSFGKVVKMSFIK